MFTIGGADYTDQEILGELVEDQGPVRSCGCSWPITQVDGVWLHVFNEQLTGTDDHEPDPPDLATWLMDQQLVPARLLLEQAADLASPREAGENREYDLALVQLVINTLCLDGDSDQAERVRQAILGARRASQT